MRKLRLREVRHLPKVTQLKPSPLSAMLAPLPGAGDSRSISYLKETPSAASMENGLRGAPWEPVASKAEAGVLAAENGTGGT